jgi:SAM-dependent methyltransferase
MTIRNSVSRFSGRVDNYRRYRPGYPPQLLKLLEVECGLTQQSVIADVGSGTGLLSQLFLPHGNPVFGVEPNEEMRAAAEQILVDFPTFTSVAGSAEATSLADASVDFVSAGQAFHWFDRPRARLEFVRVLRPGGWVVVVWNERRLDSTPLLRAYEEILKTWAIDYAEVRHENVGHELKAFFAPEGFALRTFENGQLLDFDGLKGRLLSSSYTPEPGDPSFPPMVEKLRRIFDEHQRYGRVTIEYNTRVYFGRLSPILS